MRGERQLVRSLQRAMDAVASEVTKTWWERYFKGASEFRGVGIPQIRCTLAA